MSLVEVDMRSTVSGGDHVNQIDGQPLQELIDAHGAALTLFARQWCRTPEDAVQEALVDLVRQTPVPDNLVGWLYTTVRRKAMNLARAEGRRAKHHRQAGGQHEVWFVPPNSHLDEQIDYGSLLARLPPTERKIVVARIWGELSFAQIAGLVERPLSTVHRRYQRALSELGRMIKQLENPKQSNESKPTLS